MTLELFIQILAIVLIPIISAIFWVDRNIRKNGQKVKILEEKVKQLEMKQEKNSLDFNEIKITLSQIVQKLDWIGEYFDLKPKQ